MAQSPWTPTVVLQDESATTLVITSSGDIVSQAATIAMDSKGDMTLSGAVTATADSNQVHSKRSLEPDTAQTVTLVCAGTSSFAAISAYRELTVHAERTLRSLGMGRSV